MSLIPLDEQRGDGPSAPKSGPNDTSILGRFLAGVKAVLLSLPGASAMAAESSADAHTPSPDDGAERGDAPERKAPATLPGGAADGQVEVVTTESGDVLTVEAVDNPDAAISSDTWEPVER